MGYISTTYVEASSLIISKFVCNETFAWKNLEMNNHLVIYISEKLVNSVSPLMCETSKQDMTSHTKMYIGKCGWSPPPQANRESYETMEKHRAVGKV
jgi:hypothetical protein